MKRLGIALVLTACGATLAACSAGGGTLAPGAGASGGSGSSASSGGTGSTAAGGTTTKGSGGSSAGGTSGTTATGGSGATGGTSGTSGSAGSTAVGQTLDCPATGQIGSPVLRLMTRTEFDNTINDLFPSLSGQWTDSLPANITVDSGFDNDSGAVVGNQLASALLDTATSIATAVTGSTLVNTLACAGTTKDHACAKTFLDTTGKRFFRRALTDAEETRYLTFFDTALTASDFPTALKWVTVGLIQSPNSVYRSELGTVQADGSRTLTQDELATEVAYTFGGSAPTADLLTAFEGNTTTPVVEAQKLLQTAKGAQVMQHFFEQYLTYAGAGAVVRTLDAPDPIAYANVAADMLTETRAFISNVVIAGNGSLKDLLTSNTTYPSANLATYYGFPVPGADGSVTRPQGQGIGIFAQGAFLASHANSDYSSPTQRGLVPYYRLMCQPKLSPPGTVPPITDTDTQAANTTRELYETTHLAGNSTCKSCHQYFDPIGFGFEAFDQGGRFRTQQPNAQGTEFPIDPSGQVLDQSGNVLFTFKNEEDLVTQLATQIESSQCFSAYLATYAFGSTTACLAGSTMASGVNDGSLSIVKAFASLASEGNFTTRNAQ